MLAAIGAGEAAIIVAAIGAIPATIGAVLAGKAARRTSDAKGVSEAVGAEMRPNGGGSLRDAIDRIEWRQAITDKRLVQLAEQLDRHLEVHGCPPLSDR